MRLTAGFPRSLRSLGMTRKNRIVARCTCDNTHRFLSRRSSRHFVPQDDTWGRGITHCCFLSMSVVSFPGDVSTAFHSAQHDTWVGVALCAFGCGCPTILSFRATAWESSRQAHFAPLDCHVATFVAPRNDKDESEYSTCLSGGV